MMEGKPAYHAVERVARKAQLLDFADNEIDVSDLTFSRCSSCCLKRFFKHIDTNRASASFGKCDCRASVATGKLQYQIGLANTGYEEIKKAINF